LHSSFLIYIYRIPRYRQNIRNVSPDKSPHFSISDSLSYTQEKLFSVSGSFVGQYTFSSVKVFFNMHTFSPIIENKLRLFA